MSVSMRALVPAAIVGVGLVAASFVWSAPGTLAPPAGPIEGTGRTLDEVYERIASVETELSEAGGPWEVAYFDPLSNASEPQLIVDGRAHVHAIVYYNVGLRVSDGPGETEFMILRHAFSGSSWEIATQKKVLDVVVENGLYIQWVAVNPGGSPFTVFYKSLDS